ncbi:MAG: penicillin-binding protein [Oscillospiraceae bacterium]|nr:penicillin-binding protein [Candidatus Equicaccousia limihippi]
MLIGLTSCSARGEIKFYDAQGNLMATVKDINNIAEDLKDKNQKSFIEYAVSDALSKIKEQSKCDDNAAKNILLKNCSVYTSFDPTVYKSIVNHYNDNGIEKTPFACVITDTEGLVAATFSSGSDEVNYATKKLDPYSAFKPLSVYAPALDENKITWSSVYKDSPYKNITTEEGKTSAWPQNADGKFSMTDTCVCEGIKKSLNTVAVKCLADYGVMKSIGFLQDKFGFKLEDEQKKASMSDPDEIIGNIAMGYISEGCSPVDMAGYYQMFANGGKYNVPHCVTKIIDSNNREIYTYSLKPKQVIKETTAFIMNRLLQGTTATGGTGKQAHLNGVLVGGKTGTGVTDDGNWFIGFTPQYVASVWHGKGMPKNTSPAVFSSIMKDVINSTPKKTADFPSAVGIKQEAFCMESGKLLKASCRKMSVGYYISENIPEVCNMHK